MTQHYKLGLLGYPLGHSLSPILHRAALDAVHRDGEYNLYPIPQTSQGKEQIQDLIRRIRIGELDGLNITIPHKQHIMALVDSLSPQAQAIGAVNTIFRRDGMLVGVNTDAPGFWADLQRLGWSEKSNPSRALVIGSGGSARAVTYILAMNGWDVFLAARRIYAAGIIASDITATLPTSLGSIQAIALNSQSLRSVSFCSLIVNTTPLGMYPDSAASPWPDDTPFPNNACVYDLVYNPANTALMRQASHAGLKVSNGLGMLIEQAALAFYLWTGLQVKPAVMRKALEAHLESLVSENV